MAFQLVGLAQIDLLLQQFRDDGLLIASLPSAPIVIRPNFLVRSAPGLTQQRAVFCTETPAALKAWSELALWAGEQEFWLVDWGPLPADWLQPGVAPPAPLAEASAGQLRSTRYETAAVRAVLRTDGQELEACGHGAR